MVELTPTQRRMLDVLADGEPHRKVELHACLDKPTGPLRNIATHLMMLRRELRRHGEDILTVREPGQETTYRYVRVLTPSRHA
jgi:hypothetical protein